MPESTIPYDDGFNNETEDAIADGVHEYGPLVCECITCHHCGYVEIAIHPFAESVECGGCGKRNPSAVPLYPEHHRQDGPL